ncbi:pantothenate transporter [Colletotrichum tofieldiae]|nr:pantothenate transporter [Colletotrichum tofieldiae]GKT68641.1 pantothenate transporter [Colletotrichum tofieldiae]
MTATDVHDALSAMYSEGNGDVRTAKRVGRENVIPDNELDQGAALTALTVEEEKKLIRKVDWRLIPLLVMLYLVKKLDESNVSQARIMNKGTERNILTQLGVTSNQYGMVTVLYTTEAGMFPGIILQLSYWYRPDEIAVRLM